MIAYKFLELEDFTSIDTNESFFSAYLVKYSGEFGEEVVDENSGGLSETNVKNKVIGKVRFLIIPNESLLIFHEEGNIINQSIFRNKFSELFEKNFNNFFVKTSTSPIIDEYFFLDEITKFQSLKNITISLVPSNPRFSDRWRDIDERLRNNHVTNYKEILENKSSGSVELDDETKSKVYMSEDGYGETTATGIDDQGNKRTN